MRRTPARHATIGGPTTKTKDTAMKLARLRRRRARLRRNFQSRSKL